MFSHHDVTKSPWGVTNHRLHWAPLQLNTALLRSMRQFITARKTAGHCMKDCFDDVEELFHLQEATSPHPYVKKEWYSSDPQHIAAGASY